MFGAGREYAFGLLVAVFFAVFGSFAAAEAADSRDEAQNSTLAAVSSGKTTRVLGISWMPGFCEKASKTPECRNQTSASVEARQFSLSGLWRVRKTYCGVEASLRDRDRKKDWLSMPDISLAADVRLELARAMPGVASGYERHQWVKYGTCSGLAADDYYGRALKMLSELNRSEVRRLFEDNLGNTVREADVKAAFDAAFGAGAGDRVRMRCSKDGDRRVITGLTIGLGGSEGEDELGRLIAAARRTKFGCAEGVVDAAGLQ